MFKIKTKNRSFRKRIEETYFITDSEEYNYLITDDPAMIENDKINIIFHEGLIASADQLLANIISGLDVFVTVTNAQGYKKINVKDVEYFEALENDVFAVVGSVHYDCSEKLYTLEEKLKSKNFVRTSKSFLVNIGKIDYIKPMLNYKLLLIMNNGDKIDVNRTYMKSFKAALEL